MRFRRALLHALVLVTASTPLAAGSPSASSAADGHAGCDLYASPRGNDTRSGSTPETSLASPLTMLSRLGPGQTGCLEDGATFVFGKFESITKAAGTPGAPKTLRPTTPGARSTILTTTPFWIHPDAHDLVLEDLNFRRSQPEGGASMLMVDGDRVSMTGMDLSFPHNICLDVGDDSRVFGDDDSNDPVDPTEDFSLTRSRVHGCGASYGPPRPQENGAHDSGVHGIYLQMIRDGADADSIGALIEDNLVYDNHNRGIQLYPDVHDAVIRRNAVHGNGANINIGSELEKGVLSRDNLVTRNVIGDSGLSGLEPGGFVGDQAEILGNFPAGHPALNTVTQNCIWNRAHPGALRLGAGIAYSDNLENRPAAFVDAAGGDFRQTSASPCRAHGPAAIEPGLSVSDTRVTEGTSASPTSMQVTLTRTGDTSSASSVQVFATPGTATSPADYRLNSSTITLAPGQTTATVAVEVAADTVDESDETFSIELSSPTGAILARSRATATIVDDDSLSVYGVDAQVRAPGASSFTGGGRGTAVTARLRRGATHEYTLRVLNTGSQQDSFAMVGSRSTRGLTVNYLDQATDRTSEFLSGTASTGLMGAGTDKTYRVRIGLARSLRPGSRRSVVLHAVSGGAARVDTDLRDTLRLRVVVR